MDVYVHMHMYVSVCLYLCACTPHVYIVALEARRECQIQKSLSYRQFGNHLVWMLERATRLLRC